MFTARNALSPYRKVALFKVLNDGCVCTGMQHLLQHVSAYDTSVCIIRLILMPKHVANLGYEVISVDKEPTLIVIMSSELLTELFLAFQFRKKIWLLKKDRESVFRRHIKQTDRQTFGSQSAKFCFPYILIQGLPVHLKYAILFPLRVEEMVQL